MTAPQAARCAARGLLAVALVAGLPGTGAAERPGAAQEPPVRLFGPPPPVPPAVITRGPTAA